MRYLEPLIGFLASLWFLIASLLAARSRRGWQQKAEILLGISGISGFGLILYGQYSLRTHALYSLKALLGGISIGIFVTLWLEGSLNLLTRLKSRAHEPPEPSRPEP